MSFIYVARSAAFTKWAGDVGLGKSVFKIGCCETAPKAFVEQAAWGGETDWRLVKSEAAPEGATEADIIERLRKRDTMVDPAYYPKLKGATGIFKVPAERVQNHLLTQQAVSGEPLRVESAKPKPADFAGYLIHRGTGGGNII